jgi:hypothetical protein
MEREGELRRQQAIESINRQATPLQLLGCEARAACQRIFKVFNKVFKV